MTSTSSAPDPDASDPDTRDLDDAAPASSTAHDPADDVAGPDLARELLARARREARASGAEPSSGRRGSATAGSGGRQGRRSRGPVPSGGFSGPGPDERDPQLVGSTVERLVDQRRWRDPLSIGSVLAAWPAVAGTEVAAHCVPERVEDGVLVVRADSTAWATQLRLLAATIVARLGEELAGPGDGGAITSVTVLGPSAPSWKKGPRSVPGRGPRDTYG